MRPTLIAIVLALMSQSANADCVFKNGRWVCDRPGILARATYRPQPRIARHAAPPAAVEPTLAEPLTAPAPAACADCEPEHSVVHGRRPIRRLLRGTCRVAAAPFRFMGKSVRGVRSRRSCGH
jgi:hypothetical protein